MGLNIGTGELFVILLIALIIFGPQKLPEMARTLGRALRSFQEEGRKAAATLRSAVEDEPSMVGVVDRPDASPGEPAPETPAAPAAHDEPAAGDEPAAREPAARDEPAAGDERARTEGADAEEAPPEAAIDRGARLLEDT